MDEQATRVTCSGAMLMPALFVLHAQAAPPFRWAYLWLAGAGLLLVLTFLAFLYLLARHRGDRLCRLAHHPVLRHADAWLSERAPRLRAFIRQRFTASRWQGLALTLASLATFSAVYLFVRIIESWTDEEVLYAFDQWIYEGLTASVYEPMAAFMRGITHLGDGLTITLLSLLLGGFLLLRRYYWHVVSLVLSVGVGSALNRGLKWFFTRSRPDESLLQATGHSFPSGHAFLAMTFYGYVLYLIWCHVDHEALRIGAAMLLTLLIVLIGLSRVVLRVHWASDVAGGFMVGLAWLIASLLLTRALQAYRASSGPARAA